VQVAPRFLQTAYAGLTKSLQLEWQYLQQVILETGAVLAPIQAALANTFLPTLLEEPREKTPGLWEITTLPI